MNPLQELEREVLSEGQEWTRQRLEQRLQEQAEGMRCGPEGEPLRDLRQRSLELKTVSGVVRIKVWYGYSKARKQWVCPARERWGLQTYQRVSPELQERLCYTATEVGSYERAARMASRWGSEVSDDTIHHHVQEQGALVNAESWPPMKPQEKEPAFSMVIMMDGWMVRERGPDWAAKASKAELKRVAWHEIKSALIYRLEQRVENSKGRGLLLEKYTVACAPETDPSDFGSAVQSEALRRGLGRAQKVYVIMDGAVWLWQLAEDRFSEAIKGLDFHHASEHLWALGRALYGENEPQTKRWVEGLLHQLRHGKEKRVIRRLEQVLKQTQKEAAEVDPAISREVNYFRTHADHIHYQDLDQNGAPIGSGTVESLCAQLQRRFKNGGQFWDRPGLTHLLALTTTFRNKDERYLWN